VVFDVHDDFDGVEAHEWLVGASVSSVGSSQRDRICKKRQESSLIRQRCSKSD
jgi:hypothetical protein